MAKKITRWLPDTCECVFEYEWDTEDPETFRIHTLTRVVKSCAKHSHPDPIVQFKRALEDNKKKAVNG